MTKPILVALAATLLTSVADPARADVFNRVASFHVVDNLPAGADPKAETAAEIIAATADGLTLVYTDSPGKRLGFIDITTPAAPKAAGTLALTGEPTSVAVLGSTAFVALNTSPSFTAPSGDLVTVDIATKAVTATCALGGQPDSIAVNAAGTWIAIAIENERDEKVNDGAIPQMPAGFLAVLPVKNGAVDCAGLKRVDMTGLAAVAGDDPEPEFVDINARDEAVVTLQENNHIAIVDLATAKVTAHFSAGTVDLKAIDVKRDGVIDLSGEKAGVPREPDAVKWIDTDRFITADEGDYKGGSRGYTIFDRTGKVLHSPGNELDHLAVRLGHYPEKRNSKGVEPEGVAAATYGADKLLFVAAERSSLVSVYQDTGAAPRFLQALPGGVGPEGLLALPARGLFVTASEADNREDGGIGSVVTVYARGPGAAAYPTIVSANDASGLPIAWGALSGLAGHPTASGQLYAVTDSFYSQGRILTIDATKSPATITGAITVTKDGKPMENLDLEGVAVAADGGFWLASEGNPEREKNKTNSTLVKTDAKGVVERVIELPEGLRANATRFGFEGVAVTGQGDAERVWIAVQREWKDDPKGQVRLIAIDPKTGAFGQARYPLEPKGEGWIGLSDLTSVPGGFIVLERDNLIGPKAKVKILTRVSLDGVTPAALDAADAPVVKKTVIKDLMPLLKAANGYVLDKPEGFTLDATGTAYLVTDNDGIDGSSGETQFFNLGKLP